MTNYVLIKYLHFIGIFLTVGGVFAQLWMVKGSLTRAEIKTLGKIDGLYGLGAVLTVGAGLTLWLSDIGKPAEFYATHGVVYWKLAVFSIVGILSIFPTIFFARQRQSKKNPNGEEWVTVPAGLRWLIRIEFALLLIMPYLGSLTALGLPLW